MKLVILLVTFLSSSVLYGKVVAAFPRHVLDRFNSDVLSRHRMLDDNNDQNEDSNDGEGNLECNFDMDVREATVDLKMR